MDKREMKIGRSLYIQSKKESIDKDYEFVKEVGSGGFGKVHEAILRRNPAIRRAIKSIRKSKMICNETLRNQIEILSMVDHPNIIKIFQTYEDDHYFHIVMDLCTGGEFFYYLIERGSISERDARHFFKQMVLAVQYCHFKKIAHRDLKPQNFLLLSESVKNIKLIDFGLAVKWQQSMKEEIRENKMIGTPYYVSPEAILKKSYDERCDIWSLGVILYIMVTAMPPFNGSTDKEIIKAVRRGIYNSSGTELTGLSQELKNLIARMLSPVDRRITIGEILNHPWIKKEPTSAEHKLNYGKIYGYVRSNHFKKLAVNCIASQLSDQEISKIGELFHQIDKDGNGFISSLEFKKTLLSQKLLVSNKEIMQVLDSIDIDRDGIINYSEFLTSCLQNAIIFKKQNIINAFELLDKDCDGKVSVSELRHLLQKLNSDITGLEIEELIKAADRNKDGNLDLEQFTYALAKW